MKNYQCEYPNCTTMCNIRTTVKNKDSEFYKLKVCSFHANQLRPKTISDKTRRTQEARKEQRKDYPEFYQKHVEIAGKKKCEECGKKLQGNSTEICHILAKTDTQNPELATEDLNIVYLCSDCHNKFDHSGTSRQSMNVYPLAQERLKSIHEKIIKKSAQYFWMFP